jgi:oxalate decarboxylase/phosphoglucose isomerase-like protein (cupin superfamily)
MKNVISLYDKTPYMRWIHSEGIPVHEGFGIPDVRELKLAPWSRTGGNAAFIHLFGMQGVTGMYVAEIPPGGELKPERHLYEEVICILQGHGGTEVWNDGGRKQLFEWGPWSLFAPPLNSRHRLVNGGREPVKFLAVTNAPMVLDMYRNTDFVFNCPYSFFDRYQGEEDFFGVGKKRYTHGLQNIWETNFIPDIKAAFLDELELKGAGLRLTQFEISGNSLIGHLGEWPVGKYHKAHYHGPGAIIVGLQSVGYVILWSKELGTRPYESGHGDKVVEIAWTEASVYCPPANWFHQHLNTGKEPARHLAVRYGSRVHPLGFKVAAQRAAEEVYIDIKEGGTLIEYKNEDPEIRVRYEEALKKTGVASQMPKVN